MSVPEIGAIHERRSLTELRYAVREGKKCRLGGIKAYQTLKVGVLSSTIEYPVVELTLMFGAWE